ELGESFFDFLPDRERINQTRFTRERRDVKVAAPGSVDECAETGRNLEPSLVVDSRCSVSSQHRLIPKKPVCCSFGHFGPHQSTRTPLTCQQEFLSKFKGKRELAADCTDDTDRSAQLALSAAYLQLSNWSNSRLTPIPCRA